MEFKYIEDVIQGIQLDLVVCKTISQRYKTILYQHEGKLSFSNTKIGDITSLKIKFDNFIDYCKNQKPDLVITPEYSTRLESINELITNKKNAIKKGALWVLGSESITMAELDNMKNELENNSTYFHYDFKLDCSHGNFLDPVFYLFYGKLNNEDKLFVIVQFKNYHMGVWSGGEIESNNMIQGRELYILRNSPESIFVLTLICSEAMNIIDEGRKITHFDHLPFLIINIQCNSAPLHRNFVDFRKYILVKNCKEIIVLNWHINSLLDRHKMFENTSPRSSIYYISNEFNFDDEKNYCSCYKKGVYFFKYKQSDRYNFIFNPYMHILEFRNQPVHINNVQAVQKRRNGILMDNCYLIKKNTHELVRIKKNLLGGSTNLLFKYYSKRVNYLYDRNVEILNKERLINLSLGLLDIKKGTNWYKNSYINTLTIDLDTETNKSFALCEKGNSSQMYYVSEIRVLCDLISDKNELPHSLRSIYDMSIPVLGFESNSIQDNYMYNIIDDKTQKSLNVCLVILNESYDELNANKQFESIKNSLIGNNFSRLVIYYRKRGVINYIHQDSLPIYDATSFSNNSIFKD